MKKKFINLEYEKNSRNEIVFKNLNEIKEGDNVVLRLKDGDFSAFYILLSSCKLPFDTTLILPHFPQDIEYFEGKCIEKMLAGGKCIQFFDKNINNNDLRFDIKKPLSILPKWDIPKDNAVLFLSDEDKEKYKCLYEKNKQFTIKYKTKKDIQEYNKECEKREKEYLLEHPNGGIEFSSMVEGWQFPSHDFLGIYEKVDKNCKDNEICEVAIVGRYSKITIIAPEIHAEPTQKDCKYHIENMNNIAKELKEKFDVKEVNVCASHCHGYIDLLDWENCEGNMLTTLYFQTTQDDDYDAVNNAIKLNINKITTTNSTGILEVQKNDRLEVIDVEKFF